MSDLQETVFAKETEVASFKANISSLKHEGVFRMTDSDKDQGGGARPILPMSDHNDEKQGEQKEILDLKVKIIKMKVFFLLFLVSAPSVHLAHTGEYLLIFPKAERSRPRRFGRSY